MGLVRKWRSRLLVAMLAVLAVLAVLLGTVPGASLPSAQASGQEASPSVLHGFQYKGKLWAPSQPGIKPSHATVVPGHSVKPASAAEMATLKAAVVKKGMSKGAVAPVRDSPPKVSWPAGTGSASLTVAAGDKGDSAGGGSSSGAARVAIAQGWRQAGSLPVSVQAVTARGADAGIAAAAARGSASGALVTVASRNATATLGVHGMVLTVAGTGALASAGGRVGVRVSYSGFAGAYGGAYASRLRLVALPACALTSPGAARCRRATPVPTVNDGTGTLSGTVSLPAAAGAGQAAAGTAKPAVAAAPAAVLAVESAPSGAEGDYAATPLTPTGTWAVQDGDYTYSYPITTPPSVAGDTPSVALAYDSQSVDGETSGSNTQGGWIGDGWSYSPGSISMSYDACSMDTNADPATDADECWGGYDATLALDGHSSRLVLNGGSGNTYHLQDDDGTQVQLLTGADNGLWDGQYWLVTTSDGTQYYFGLNHLPGTASGGAATSSAWGMPVYCPGTTDPCYSSSTGDDSWQTLGWQWNLDYVVSPLGALTEYTYQDEANYYERDAGNADGGTLTQYVRAGFPVSVQYGWLLADAVAGTARRRR